MTVLLKTEVIGFKDVLEMFCFKMIGFFIGISLVKCCSLFQKMLLDNNQIH